MEIKDYIKGLESLKEHCVEMIDKNDPECIWRRDVEALQFAIDFIGGKSAALAELIKLAQENPELPIVPMVDNEIVAGDEFGRWMASFGKAEIREFAIDEWYGDGIIRYRDEYGAEENLIEAIAESKYDGSEEDYKKAEQEAATLWKKAIIVNIDMPD